MLVKSNAHNIELEILKWLTILALAATLALVVASRATGEVPIARDDGGRAAAVRVEQQPRLAEDDYEVAMQLWNGLALLEAKDYEGSKLVWNSFVLPGERDAWRLIALGAAHMHANELAAAAEHLQQARDVDPENPLAPFFLGVVRIKQAANAPAWREVAGPARIYVSLRNDDVVPNTQCMYLRVALEEFLRADALARFYDGEQRLLNADMVLPDRYATNMPLAVPAARNMVEVLQAENFHGRAHLNASYLFLMRDALEAAENHLDQANLLRVPTNEAYQELGERYQALGRPRDAFRVNLKAMRGGPLTSPGHDMTENILHALKKG